MGSLLETELWRGFSRGFPGRGQRQATRLLSRSHRLSAPCPKSTQQVPPRGRQRGRSRGPTLGERVPRELPAGHSPPRRRPPVCGGDKQVPAGRGQPAVGSERSEFRGGGLPEGPPSWTWELQKPHVPIQGAGPPGGDRQCEQTGLAGLGQRPGRGGGAETRDASASCDPSVRAGN